MKRLLLLVLLATLTSGPTRADELSEALQYYNEVLARFRTQEARVANADGKLNKTDVKDALEFREKLRMVLRGIKADIRRLGGKEPEESPAGESLEAPPGGKIRASSGGKSATKVIGGPKRPREIEKCFTIPDPTKLDLKNPAINRLLRSLKESFRDKPRALKEAIRRLRDHMKEVKSNWTAQEAVKYQEVWTSLMKDVVSQQDAILDSAAGDDTTKEDQWKKLLAQERSTLQKGLDRAKPIIERLKKQYKNQRDYHRAINGLMAAMAESGRTDFPYLAFLRMGLTTVDKFLEAEDRNVALIHRDALPLKRRMKERMEKIRSARRERGKKNLETLTGAPFEVLPPTASPTKTWNASWGRTAGRPTRSSTKNAEKQRAPGDTRPASIYELKIPKIHPCSFSRSPPVLLRVSRTK